MHGQGEPTAPGGEPGGTSRRSSAAGLVAGLALSGILATSLCVAIGYGIAQRSDKRHIEQQRGAVRGAISEFRAVFGNGAAVDPRFLRMIEQGASLKDLKFEPEPASTDGREMQPVVDAQGRISGFLTWEPAWPVSDAIRRMLPFLILAAVGVLAFVGYFLSQWRRIKLALALSEREARTVAEIDVASGQLNRLKIRALLKEALDGGERKPQTLAIFELTGLDDIEDEIGPARRDEVIAQAIREARVFLPPDASMGRLSGSAFAIICEGGIEGRVVLQPIVAAICALYRDDAEVRLGVHAGYATTTPDTLDSEDLMRCARLAVTAAAKKGPSSIVAFEPSLDIQLKDQNFIRRELPRAVASEALELHYQPIVAADGSRIVGVEALLRWNHPERGAIGPAVFVPVAEQMGLMDTLGAFVLRRALQEAANWPDVYIAVNLSPVQIRDRSIVDLVAKVLAGSGVEPSRLMLEITEGVLIANPDEVVKRIEELRGLGVRIALDDFGSGYSNLGYLLRFPFDKLKIDKSFVAPLGRSSNGGVILQAIVALGRALGVSVLVEGVETEEQRVLLRLAGCDEMQGYLFARPSPAKAIDKLMTQRRIGRPQKLTG